jgi:HK97 family phage major capsid protein
MSLTKLQQLQEKRGALDAHIRAKITECHKDGKWVDGEEANYNALNAEYNTVKAELDSELRSKSLADRLAELDADASQSTNTRGIGRDDAGREPKDRRPGQDGAETVTEELREVAFRAAMRRMAGMQISEKDRKAMKLCRYNGAKQLDLPLDTTKNFRRLQRAALAGNLSGRAQRLEAEMRALDSVTLAKGGVLVPQTLIRTIEMNMLYFGPMLMTSETLVTGDGGPLSWPTVDDTGNEGSLIGEATASSDVDPSFGALVLNAFKFTSGAVKVSEEMLQDSAIDLVSVIASMLGERLGRIENKKFTTGTGANEPQGIVTASTMGKTTGGAAITYNEVVELMHSVDVAYRNAPGVGFMMHDAIQMAVRLIRDTDNSLIYKGGAAFDQPDTFNGKPIYINNHMDSATTAAKKVILFGDLSKYKIRRAGSLRFYRMDERYRDTDQTGFLAFTRSDAGLLSAGTVPVKHLLITG